MSQYKLTNTAEEIDEKLKRIPLANASETSWHRDDCWVAIADQEYDPESCFAQSGKAVASAVSAVLSDVEEQLKDFSVEIDQEYNAESENAQSGKAVAQAIAAIEFPEAAPPVTVDQTYDASSKNAQSGIAVAQAIAASLDTLRDEIPEVVAITTEEIAEMFSEPE